MSNAMLKGVISPTFQAKRGCPLADLPKDQAAVKALLQAAINVENFTIPLYLASLSSVQGTHAIKGGPANRLWPGMTPTPTPPGAALTPNQQAYNSVFSVFIQEMLHLQLAANLATVLGVLPRFFKGTVLENETGGWSCYGPQLTTIPHIIDLTDTTSFSSVAVNLAPLDSKQIELFLAVEQSHHEALKDIKEKAKDKYFPATPFENWTDHSTEADLPLFGTIGWMYKCLIDYLGMEYEGGGTLWAKMFKADRLDRQRDLFNIANKSHPCPEYPLMPTQVSASDPDMALLQAIDMIHGIVNQGEGGIENILKSFRLHVQARIDRHVTVNENMTLRDEVTDNHVEYKYQPDHCALKEDYSPGNADARAKGDEIDHWDRFDRLRGVVKNTAFVNFAQWFAAGNKWQGADLHTRDYVPAPNQPTPQEVADALNGMKTPAYQTLLDQLIVGAIDGINNTLTLSWTDASTAFPYQAMTASGDRMSLYWAVFGSAPDISKGNPAPKPGDETHACQGLSTNDPGNNCAAISAYHTCAGSNACKGQSGCGYPKQEGTNYVAPSDNMCAQKGGCAAPISVWQSYGMGGVMDVIDIDNNGKSIPPGTIPFTKGETVYDTAWNVYTAVMANKKKTVEKPKANPLRIALPPN